MFDRHRQLGWLDSDRTASLFEQVAIDETSQFDFTTEIFGETLGNLCAQFRADASRLTRGDDDAGARLRAIGLSS